jgi:predicted amidohydrolase YtcJ
MHPVLGATRFTGVDLTGCRSVAELRAALAEELARTPRGGWVTGWGLLHDAFEGRRIAKDVIDDVLGDVPAMINFFDAHSALASSAALAAAGIDGPREFASRSRIVCDAEGVPTGQLLEFDAMAPVQRVMPVADIAVRRAKVYEVLSTMAASGLTGGHVMDAEGDALELIAGIAELPIRLRIAPWAMPGLGAADLERLLELRGRAGQRWSVDAVKFFLDGTVEGGTAWMELADCHGQNTDSFWRDPAAYTRAVHQLAAAGFQTVTHAIGDAAVRHALDTLADAERHAPHRIEHVETLPSAQLARFAQLDVVASMQPTHASFTRADHTDEWSSRLGAERAGRGWPCRDLRDSGATLVLGSDWPVAPFDPRRVLAAAQLRRLPGSDAAPVNPQQALTAQMALEGMTTHAAAATGLADRAGRIAPGYRADLTAFTVDPVDAPPDELAEAPIRFTMVDGVLTSS